ncbi:hypothetical protein P1S61_07425 [Streptomyces sp. ME08-AFT2]|uniref:hypothetical protein n=1 Tax=Streptomyces sp. ME08-AFT2 TaxID=3028683 RepID=UPI0029A7D4D3|nr:hypothetical protein [Streptomyces sp. ME08-AFT2]MDX3308933.1 hypothetical protein [Streptomyces sp. ME08-AFT2]
MTTPRPRPAGKSITPIPDQPHPAEPASPHTTVGEPAGAARKGAPTALRPDPSMGDGRYPVAWLHIVAPRGVTPTATSKCLCGRDRSAVGHRRVLALITDHSAHRDTCPLRTPQEGRTAA